MEVSVFSLAIIKLDERFQQMQFDMEERLHILKLFEYATMIELEEDDELPMVVLRGFKEMSKGIATFIVNTRNSEPFSALALPMERFVYRTLARIYKQNG